MQGYDSIPHSYINNSLFNTSPSVYILVQRLTLLANKGVVNESFSIFDNYHQ